MAGSSPAWPVFRVVIWINILLAAGSLACRWWELPDWPHLYLPLDWESLMAGRWWSCFTYMWIHAPFEGVGVFHIVCNMTTLAPFGRAVEGVLGRGRFWALYLSGGLGGAAGFVLETFIRQEWCGVPEGGHPGMVGASAAVLGVVTAFALLFPQARMGLMFLPFRLRAGWFLLGFALLSTAFLFVPAAGFIAHSAHLGGMLGGWLCMRYGVGMRRDPQEIRY
ncbi:MAG: rhomboid family intramembrane serine protease [Candidatus Methylacidiphilales bacterium]|nr:rhomboid family intramembrane serine protease [Candidatus Methylacidiphilales bacterium]